MNYIDTALNSAWALLCVGALVFHFIRERGNSHAHTQRVRAIRMLSVFLAAVSLFPCISASDDGIRLRDLAAGIPQEAAFNQSRAGNLPLLAQLEDLEHAQTSTPFVLVLVLCFFIMVHMEQSGILRCFHADSQSRAPPAF